MESLRLEIMINTDIQNMAYMILVSALVPLDQFEFSNFYSDLVREGL